MRYVRKLAPGTYVKFKGNPLGYRNKFAIVLEHTPNDAVYLKTEGSDNALAARHEISVVKGEPSNPIRPLRHELPYGRWLCADGREVLFNRDYKPIWHRRPGEIAKRADPDEIVPFMQQEWFYKDGKQPWRSVKAEQKCNKILEDWGIPLPLPLSPPLRLNADQ